MRGEQHRSAVVIGLNVVALTVCLAYASGCGSGTPSSFADVPDAQAHDDLAAAATEWVQAQRTGDHATLASLYDPSYCFNGMSALDMAHVLVLPDTPDTFVQAIACRFIPSTAQADRNGRQEADGERLARARITAIGLVSADVLRQYASAVPTEEHTHTHRIGPLAQRGRHGEYDHEEGDHLPGTVAARATWDVEWDFRNDSDRPLIIRQQVIRGELSLGGGVSDPLLAEVHAHPHDPHPQEPVQVHGHFAALPPGGAIEVRLGPDHEADAALEAGAFHAEVLAPEKPGHYVAHVRAFGGSVPSRTAALTVVEVGVSVQ